MPPKQRAKKKKKPNKAIRKTKQKGYTSLQSAPPLRRPVAGMVGFAAPVAYQPSYPQSYTRIENFNDSKQGIKNGIRVKFCGPIFIATTTVAGGVTSKIGSYNTLVSRPDPTFADGAYFPVNPNYILPAGTPCNATLNYSRFCFKKLKLHWVGTRQTNANELMAIGFDGDGAVLPGDFPTYNSYLPLTPHAYIQCWSAMAIDVSSQLNTKDWFYTDDSSVVSSEGSREAYQGVALMRMDPTSASNTAVLSNGLLYAEGIVECDTISPYSQNIALAISEARKGEHIKRAQRVVRTEHKERVSQSPEPLLSGSK